MENYRIHMWQLLWQLTGDKPPNASNTEIMQNQKHKHIKHVQQKHCNITETMQGTFRGKFGELLGHPAQVFGIIARNIYGLVS